MIKSEKNTSIWFSISALFATKWKFILGTLKLFKLGKIGGTIITMGIMAFTYSRIHGWPFAVGIVLAILIHELGHSFAAYYVGVKVSAPVFIPFVGAFIKLKDPGMNEYERFLISSGGPIAGALIGIIFFGLSQLENYSDYSPLLLGLAYFCMTMNLFNLVPIGFLDGSKMIRELEVPELLIGTLILLFFTLNMGYQNPMSFLLLFMLGLNLFNKYRSRRTQSLPKLEMTERIFFTVVYFSLSGFLTYSSHVIFVKL